MIELPEALTLAYQLKTTLCGKTVARVMPPTKPHKFCWWNGDPCDYEKNLCGSRLSNAHGFGMFVDMSFDNGAMLCVNDGVNLHYSDLSDAPKNYQLLIIFTDNTALAFTVAMYGGIILHDEYYDNEYYLKSKEYISPFEDDFNTYFFKTIDNIKSTFSVKAFLATEQRFPGIGNGVLQDILFNAQLNPKRKIISLNDNERNSLEKATVKTLKCMTESGGRDTEKDIFGYNGGYITSMSKNGVNRGCPLCGGVIKKEAYLGGSVYYCPQCQSI